MKNLLVTTLFLALAVPAIAQQSEAAKKAVQTFRDASYGAFWDKLDAAREMGSENTADAVLALTEALKSKELSVREAGAEAIARIKNDAALELIYKLAQRHRDGAIRSGLIWGMRLDKNTSDEAIAVYDAALNDREAGARAEAARAIRQLIPEMPVKDGRDDKMASSGAAVSKSLSRERDVEAASEKLLALAALKATDAVDTAEKMAKGGNPLIRAAALEALAALDKAKFLALAERAKKDSRPEVRMGVAYGLLHLTCDDGIEVAKTLVGDKDWRVRATTIDPLFEWHDKRAITAMCNQMAEEQGRLQYDFGRALALATGTDRGYDGKMWKQWWDAAGAGFELPKKPKVDSRASTSQSAKKDEGGSVATFFGIPILSNAAVFAIDFSGSMRNELKKGSFAKGGKSKLEVAFEQMEQCLNRFNKYQKFSGVNVSTEAAAQKIRYLSRSLVNATKGNRFRLMQAFKKADTQLAKVQRGRGDVYDAMRDAVESIRGTDCILLLSDGKPTYGDYIEKDNFIEGWKRYNKYKRVMLYTILVGGRSGDRTFMREMAESTHGFFLDATK